ncbi:spore coat protein YsxE [Bacillus sp. CGMCC 1.16607]|uniref:spore coat protein YsxE n=1 Tax=Bacillus sp. CGMCC 1.16607 TaxID=3351842 RepID=UPI003643A085
MNDHTIVQGLDPILKYYGIQANFVEKYGKIYKIYSNKGTFALKQIPIHHGIDFIKHVQYLFQKGFNRIVPIYPSLDGRYAILYENTLYYLMPWLINDEKEDRDKRPQLMFRELARMHSLSQKELVVNKEERTEHYEKTKQQWEKDIELMEGFIETCEKKMYMSPFELQFCLYFHEIRLAQRYALTRFEEWYEATKDNEKARSVINHGKVSTEHFLFDEKGYGYFSNFEDSGLGSPIHDVLPVLYRSLKGQLRKFDEALTWLYDGYFKYFPLKEEEKLLFYSYVSYPNPIIRITKEYLQANEKRNELKFSQKLLKRYWQLKNTEYIVMRMTEIEKQLKQKKEGAPE